MWGIDFNNDNKRIELPLVTSQWFVGLAVTLLLLRIAIHYMLEKWMGVRALRKQHNPSSLDFSYFYHLSIVMLGLSELRWNLFDLCLWVFSYVCVGMLRKAVHTINVERDFLINDYAYNNQIAKLLTNSTLLALLLLPCALAYIGSIHLLFLGVRHKVIAMLCFPSIMLALDSLFLLAASWQTQSHLVYFFNQNINGMSPVSRIQLYYKICSFAIKCSHFFNLSILCSSIILEKIDFLDCMWIVSVLGAFYQSASGMVRSIYKYRSMQKLARGINKILVKVKKASDEICIICMEPLLNSHKLLQCGHLFHYKCLFQWIQTKEQCPVCRVAINLNQ